MTYYQVRFEELYKNDYFLKSSKAYKTKQEAQKVKEQLDIFFMTKEFSIYRVRIIELEVLENDK